MRFVSHILVAALVFLITFLAVDLIRRTRADLTFHLARGIPDLQRAQRLDPQRAAIPREIADAWMAGFPPRADRALPAYRAAAALEPAEGLHWIGLARASLSLKRLELTSRALAAAEFVDPNNQIIQKELGSVYMELGNEERAIRHHARALALNPEFMQTLIPYYLGLGLSPRALAERLLARNPRPLNDFFNRCLADGIAPVEAAPLWQYISTSPGVPDSQALRGYFAYLIAHREYPAARELWGYIARTIYHLSWNPAREPLWNADLKRAPLFPHGLEWQIGSPLPDGCSVEIVQQGNTRPTSPSLALRFRRNE